MVARHCKLRVLFLHYYIVELLLLRKFVAQSHAVVIYAEADAYVALHGSLIERYGELVVVIAYCGSLAPYRTPCLVEGGSLRVLHRKAIHEVLLVRPVGGVLVLRQFQSEMRRTYHFLLLVSHLVCGASVLQIELHRNVAVRRCHSLRTCPQCEGKCKC